MYPGRRAYHYAHGIAVKDKGIGMGTKLMAERLEKILGPDDLMFGYTSAQPVNIPLLMLYLKFGGAVFRVEQVYESGKSYFGIVCDPKTEYSDKGIKVPLSEYFLRKIRGHTDVGFAGTEIEREGREFWLVLRRRVS